MNIDIPDKTASVQGVSTARTVNSCQQGESLVDGAAYCPCATSLRPGIFRSGPRGNEEPAGKTCNLPRFHIMPVFFLLCKTLRRRRSRHFHESGLTLKLA